MRHGALAALAATVSIATAAAVIATVSFVSASTSAASSMVPVAPSPRAESLAPASHDGFDASTSGKPFDRSAMEAGFAGPYRFVAHLEGLPGLMNLGGVVQGSVTGPSHFVLDFPQSTFITRYTRNGATAHAVLNGKTIAVQPGPDTAGAISPEDMLPQAVWGQLIAMWESTLQPDVAPGAFAADTAILTSKAKAEGILASGWQLSAKTDASGRLTSLSFSGQSWSQSFAIDVVILYG